MRGSYAASGGLSSNTPEETRSDAARATISFATESSLAATNSESGNSGFGNHSSSMLSMREILRTASPCTRVKLPAFSKKASRHALAVALHYMIYNYVRPHCTLTKNADGVKTTPAMAAGVAKAPWTVEHILAMIDGDVLLGVAA